MDRPVPARRRLRLLLAATACALLLLGSVPAVAQEDEESDSATVHATVTIAEPVEACLLVAVEEIDFGVLDFGESATSEAYAVTSCSIGDQDVFAQGTDAANDAETVDWALVDGAAGRDTDEFSVDAALDGVGNEWLVTDPRLLGVLAAEASADATHDLVLPPPGSSGAGETLTFDLVWIVAVSD